MFSGLTRGSVPARVKKRLQNKSWSPASDSLRSGALGTSNRKMQADVGTDRAEASLGRRALPERPWSKGRRAMTMNHYYRWVIVMAGGLLGCVAIGAMFSLPVFLRLMSQDTGWSVTGISTAMTIGFLAMAAASMVAIFRTGSGHSRWSRWRRAWRSPAGRNR